MDGVRRSATHLAHEARLKRRTEMKTIGWWFGLALDLLVLGLLFGIVWNVGLAGMN